MKNKLPFFLLGIISVLLAASALQQKYSHILPEADYPYWGEYRFTNSLEGIKPQKWISQNHTIEGWDWSLPKNVEPSSLSLLTVVRTGSLKSKVKPIGSVSFGINPACEMWIPWKEMEPNEGDYRWDEVIASIKQIKEAGYEVVFRPLFSARTRKGTTDLGYAPAWLGKYNIPDMPAKPATRPSPENVVCYDPAHPEFHKRYIKFLHELKKTEIPDLVKAAYVGYGYRSHGEERISPEGTIADTVQHVLERLDAWADAFEGQTHKVYMGGPSDYGFKLGFGIRRGFVEMYWYTLPDATVGQYLDDNGYLCVDESVPVVKNNTFNGDENEEYEEKWATDERLCRFGTNTRSFPYRYFMSMNRAMQLRCSALLLNGHLIPEMLPYISLELGRTIQDTPDIWSFLCESTLRAQMFTGKDFDGHDRSSGKQITPDEKKNGVAVKNMERWLYQRDRPGFETVPALPIQQPIKMWMIQDGEYVDYIARKGAKIGFFTDRRFDCPGSKAVKITYLDDTENGQLLLNYTDENKKARSLSVSLTGDGKLKTSTFIVNDMNLSGPEDDFDFILQAGKNTGEITISIVRIVRM